MTNMTKFRVGDVVSYEPDASGMREGTAIVREINGETVMGFAERWRPGPLGPGGNRVGAVAVMARSRYAPHSPHHSGVIP